MSRLRRDNEKLRKHVAKHTQENVEKLENEIDDTRRLADSFKSQFLSTQASLESTTEKLKLSEENVCHLNAKLEEANREIKARNEQIDQEKVAHSNSLKAAEKQFKEREQCLKEKAVSDLQQLRVESDDMISSVKQSHQEQLQRIEEEITRVKSSAEQEVEAVKISTDNLLRAKEVENENLIRQMRSECDAAVEKARIEREELMKKGKSMLVKERTDASLKLKLEREEHEKFVVGVKKTVEKYRADQATYEKRANSKIASYRRKFLAASSTVRELENTRAEYNEQIEDLEREKKNLVTENERLRRQIGSKKGSESDLQVQFDSLQREFNDLLAQNREIRENVRLIVTYFDYQDS